MLILFPPITVVICMFEMYSTHIHTYIPHTYTHSLNILRWRERRRRRMGGNSSFEKMLCLWSLPNTISIAELMNNKDVLSQAFMQSVMKRFRTVQDLPCWSASSRYSFNDFYLSLEHRVCSDTNTDKSIKADAICHGNYQDGSCFSSALSELCINGNSGNVGAFFF